MSTKYIDFAELKERVSIENVLTMLGVELAKRPNGQLRGVCPIHGGSDRGFVVTPSKGLWHCFSGCGGGDAIALVAKVRDLSVKDAAAEIQQHFENGNSTGNRDRTPERNSTVPDNRNRSIKPLDYLQADHETVKALGVESATAQAFGAGYAPKGIMRGRMAIPVYDRQGTLLAYCREGREPSADLPEWLPSRGAHLQRRQHYRRGTVPRA
jgi:DNA primase